MGIKKVDLRDFLERKIEEQKKATLTARREHVYAAIDPIITKILDWHNFDRVERAAEQVRSMYELMCSEFKGMPYELGAEILKKLTDLTGVEKGLRGVIRTDVHTHLTTTSTNYKGAHLKYKSEPLNAVVIVLEGDMLTFAKKTEDLKTLLREVTNIINVAPSGDKAYKTLVDLGLDLSDFQTPEYLPAVITLSVSPCLLGGTCEEESSEHTANG